jgi:uncharacterized membrane protein YjjP (DUF1212 family)
MLYDVTIVWTPPHVESGKDFSRLLSGSALGITAGLISSLSGGRTLVIFSSAIVGSSLISFRLI